MPGQDLRFDLPPLELPYGRLDRSARLRDPAGPADRSRGAGPLTLVAYADFDCVDCQTFHVAFQHLPEDLREAVRFVHRHFPLITSRPRAMQSALAVEAAHVQGAFWPMYDRLLLMEREREREPGGLERIAEELGLDVPRFRVDLRDRVHADRIWAHVRGGRASGVAGTPWLFLMGLTWRPVLDQEALEADVRAALQRL